MIDRRMVQADTINMAAYLRKMAIDGYVVKLDLPELRDMISLLRRTSNNFSQIARRVNSTNRVYKKGGAFDEVHFEDIVRTRNCNPRRRDLDIRLDAQTVRMGIRYHRYDPRYPRSCNSLARQHY